MMLIHSQNLNIELILTNPKLQNMKKKVLSSIEEANLGSKIETSADP